jgi:hypothetical protein
MPILRALGGSLTGKFRLNGKGSELLFLRPGEYIGFYDNKEAIQEAISSNHPVILEWAQESGKSPSQYPVTYYIGKGFPKFDAAGEALMTRERLGKAAIESLKASNNVDAEGNVIVPEVQLFHGSKTATNSDSKSIGCNLTFNDNVKWADLHKCLQKEHAAYAISEEGTTFDIDNGYEIVPITGYQLLDMTVESMQEEDAE